MRLLLDTESTGLLCVRRCSNTFVTTITAWKSVIARRSVRDLPIDPESGESKSPMHKSVYRRFEAGSILLYDRIAAYRPDYMRVHVDFKHHWVKSAVWTVGQPFPVYRRDRTNSYPRAASVPPEFVHCQSL